VTITGVLRLAVLGRINSSALVATLYLLSTAGSWALGHVGVNVGTICTTYLLCAAVMMLGVGTGGAAVPRSGRPGWKEQRWVGAGSS